MSKTKIIYESVNFQCPKLNLVGQDEIEEAVATPGTGLEIEVAAIHGNYVTRNNTYYPKESLVHKEKDARGIEGGLKSWTKPYSVPMILDHDKNNADKVIGRAVEAKWVDASSTEHGHVAVKFKVVDPDAIRKFVSGQYLTGSVGQEVKSASCSICSHDMVESESVCEHTPGKYYSYLPIPEESNSKSWQEVKPNTRGSKRAYVIMGPCFSREYSIVSTPSDPNSKVKNMAMAEFTEMVLVDQEENIITDFLASANITEASKEENKLPEPTQDDAVAEETEVPVVENTEVKEDEYVPMSVAEMCNLDPVKYEMIEDILSFYLSICSSLEILDQNLWDECTRFSAEEIQEHVVKMGTSDLGYRYHLEKSDRFMGKEELKSLIQYIEDTNEDCEIELKELKESVLSSTGRSSLPDSAFALVKSVEGKKLRALPYKNSDGSIDKAHLRNALARWNQVKGFSSSEKAKALRKLRAAAAKAGIGSGEGKEVVAPTSEASEELQIQVNDLLRQIAEKDAHIDTLTDKLANPVSIEKTDEVPIVDDTVVADETENPEVVVETVENQGLSLENEKKNTTENKETENVSENLRGELVLRGLLGDKRAKKKLAGYTKTILDNKK